jgi:hypothetical protein
MATVPAQHAARSGRAGTALRLAAACRHAVRVVHDRAMGQGCGPMTRHMGLYPCRAAPWATVVTP